MFRTSRQFLHTLSLTHTHTRTRARAHTHTHTRSHSKRDLGEAACPECRDNLRNICHVGSIYIAPISIHITPPHPPPSPHPPSPPTDTLLGAVSASCSSLLVCCNHHALSLPPSDPVLPHSTPLLQIRRSRVDLAVAGRCSMSRALVCVAVCCSVLQCVPVCCSVFQCVAVCRSVL